MMMKEARDWVRLCWAAWSRLPILAMKVCLLAQVTAIPSISFRNLQHKNIILVSHCVKSDKCAVSTIVMLPCCHK